MMITLVRYQGKLWKVYKQPFETEEQAKDRAWYMVTKLAHITSIAERECLSREWANKKYYDMKYKETSDTKC